MKQESPGFGRGECQEDMSTPQPLPKLECEDTILAILQNEN